ncbi:MAG: hypothetical protein DGJ47_000978, partial [Rickettsiaceae bacterium]
MIARKLLSNIAMKAFFLKSLLRYCCQFFIFITLFVLCLIRTSNAEDLDTILDRLNGLTCETDGIGNLLRTEFSHTCIPLPVSTFLVANIVSPGLYANTFLRLTINDEELFPEACERQNRADFDDPRISFSMCSNTKLAVERVGSIAKVGVAIAKSLFTDENAWDLILDSWVLPKENYHNIYRDKPIGFNDNMIDVGIIPIFPLKVIKEQDKICVATLAFTGWIPIGCKYIKEPYPISIYEDFMNPDATVEETPRTALTKCGLGSCYRRALDNSHASVVLSGPIVECVQEMITKLMISRSACSFSQVQEITNNDVTRLESTLFTFQRNMQQIVSALLAIYIILFGFRMILSGNVPEKKDLAGFVFKFLFVVYFSVGININPGLNGEAGRMDGMIQWAFPILLNGMTSIMGWVSNASPSQLCVFSDMEYTPGMEHLALWDSLDCRISYYLGIDAIINQFVSLQYLDSEYDRSDYAAFPIPPYFLLVIPSLLTGWPWIVIAVLAYPLLIIGMLAFVVNATIICMIGIVILGFLAPLFVPMYLFGFTQGYFTSWAKLLVSFMLQPLVIVTFMITMMELTDRGVYGTCQHIPVDAQLSSEDQQESLQQLDGLITGVMSTNADRVFRIFNIDREWDNYATEEDAINCRESLGYFLAYPSEALQSIEDTELDGQIDAIGTGVNAQIDSVLKESPGQFFDFVEVAVEKLQWIMMQLIIACLLIYIMTKFADQIGDFAADLTEGASVSGASIAKPNSATNMAKKAAGLAIEGIKKAITAAVVLTVAAVTVATGGVGGVVVTPVAAGAGAAKAAGAGAIKAGAAGAKGAVKAGAKAAAGAVKAGAKAAFKAVKSAGKKIPEKAAKAVKKIGKKIASKVIDKVGQSIKDVEKSADSAAKNAAKLTPAPPPPGGGAGDIPKPPSPPGGGSSLPKDSSSEDSKPTSGNTANTKDSKKPDPKAPKGDADKKKNDPNSKKQTERKDSDKLKKDSK